MNPPSFRFTPGPRLPLLAALSLPLAAVDGGTGLGLATALGFVVMLSSAGWLESRRLRLVVAPALATTANDATESLPQAVSIASLALSRMMNAKLLVGGESEVTIRAVNRSKVTLDLLIRDSLPSGWETSDEELRLKLPPGKRAERSYRVRPSARGPHRLGDLHVRLDGVWGLGGLIARLPAREDVKVYPNISGLRRFELASRLGSLRSVGVVASRLAGGGGELAHLREYVAGDPYRDLDWKSTAKRRRPISRVYEQERSQQVVVCVDAGRMMAATIEGVSKLEHAISAVLVLAWAALRQGDRVGLIVFGDSVKHYLPPKRGPQQYRAILEALYGIEAEQTSVDFRQLVEHVQTRVQRRSLLVIFSDLLDAAHARPLASHAPLLRRKHLPICVTMDDPVARSVADAPTSDAESVFRRAAAADVLDEREAIKAHLRKAAVDVVEAPASSLAVQTVNRYLEIKARHVL